MNTRGALLVALAKQNNDYQKPNSNKDKNFKINKNDFCENKLSVRSKILQKNIVTERRCDNRKLEAVQRWVNNIPLKKGTTNNTKMKKIKVLSNIILKESILNKKECNSFDEVAEKHNSIDEVEKIEKKLKSEDGSLEIDKLTESIVDDSVCDPDYLPSIASYKIFPQNDITSMMHHENDATKNDRLIHCFSDKIFQENPSDMENPAPNFNEAKVEIVKKQNYKDRRDFCMFCEKDVSHFARHMSTWHSSEIDVARILSIKDNTKKKIEYSNLRKKGNFLRNRTNIELRPVKRLKSGMAESTAGEFLPCKYCLGFYKKNSLYRHTKKCSQNTEANLQKRQTSQSDGQTTLLLGTLLKTDQLLNTELFPRMRADEISLIAKKDPLICKYAYSYMKGRRSKGNLDLVRQNVRRLSKLVIFAKKQDSTIKLLLDLLHPRHFKMIVEGVNEMAQYNHVTEKYDSPTLAMNFGTLLKKCCDLAFVKLLQLPNTREQREDVNILKTLIVSQWADEVSAQAGTNLNENKWNKEELLPLTSDLKKLNDYLFSSAEEHYEKLKVDNDCNAYDALKEILYTQILLLNRRRPAEVAQLKIQTFRTISLDTSKQDTEFESCLTETEKILLNTYSRFIIRGKRGRGVPVLLSPSMRQHFELVIAVRDKFVKDNDYIFHTKGKGFIDGTKTLSKYVKKCGIEREKSISATLLRKHLATITQLLQFSNNDMEQLSKFMGHTLKTHCDVYRMSDNIYQTAKVSKLLLLMMEGGAEKFKGKPLDEIDIDLDPVVNNQELFDELVQHAAQPVEEILEEDTHMVEKDKSVNDKKLIERLPWSNKQKRIIAKYFAQHIKRKQAPKQMEVKKFVDLHPNLFEGRKWTSIKAVVYNIFTGKLKVK